MARKYTHSERSLEQRRGAAWKHGAYARRALSQAVPPCKASTCPVGYRCDLARAMSEQGRALQACPVNLAADPEVRQRYLHAIQSGDLAGVQEISAGALASMQALFAQEVVQLTAEGGFAVEQDLYAPDGMTVGSRLVANPRAFPVLKLAELLGHTARDQAITPKSQGERRRDDSVAGFMDSMRQLQRRVEGGEA